MKRRISVHLFGLHQGLTQTLGLVSTKPSKLRVKAPENHILSADLRMLYYCFTDDNVDKIVIPQLT